MAELDLDLPPLTRDRFLESVDPHFICGVCGNVAHDPKE
jgi:hypothetical protein